MAKRLIDNKKAGWLWKTLYVAVVEVFLLTQLFWVSPISLKDSEDISLRRVIGIRGTPIQTNLPGISGILNYTQTVEGVNFDILMDTENGEVTMIRQATADAPSATSKAFFTDGGNTAVTEIREENCIEFKEFEKVTTEAGVTGRLKYNAKVVLTSDGNTVVQIYDNDMGERVEVSLYAGRDVFDRVNAGDQLLEFDSAPIGEMRNRVVITSPNQDEQEFNISVDTIGEDGKPVKIESKYSVTPSGDKWKVTQESSDGFKCEFVYQEQPTLESIMQGFDLEKIVPNSLTIDGKEALYPEGIAGIDSIMDELLYWDKVDAREPAVAMEPGRKLMGARTIRNLARALSGAMVGTYVYAHMPLSLEGSALSELLTIGAHAAVLFPMYVQLSKFFLQSIVGMGVAPETVDIPADARVLEFKFSDLGFNEGLGIFYTCKTEGEDWARAIGKSIAGNIVTESDVKEGHVSQEVISGIKQHLIDEAQAQGKTLEPSKITDLEVARELNKNLYVVLVADGNPSQDDFLNMVCLVHKLRSQYGNEIQILFSARRDGENVGFKPIATDDAIGLFTRGIGPRLYEGKIFTDPKYGAFTRNQNSPIFGVYDPGFYKKVVDYYRKHYAPTEADVSYFRRELKHLEETGWISGYYGALNSTILDIVQNRSIDHLFTLDSGNFIGVNQAVEMAAKVETALSDPAYANYGDIVMFKPHCHVANPDASFLTSFFNSTQERFYWHDAATSYIRGWAQSSGKVWIVADRYAEQAMVPGQELMEPWTVAHDWLESAVMKTVQLLGVDAYDTRYPTLNATDEVQDESYLVGMSRFLKSNDMNLLRGVYARNSAYRYVLEKMGVELMNIPLPEDPAMKQQALEIFDDAKAFCTSNDMFATFLGLTWTTGILSSAFQQAQPVYATLLLATVLGAQLILGPQILAPFFSQRREGSTAPLDETAVAEEQVAKEFLDSFEELKTTGNWAKFLNSAPVSLAKMGVEALYDVARANAFLMPLFPLQVITRRVNQTQIARTSYVIQKINSLVTEGRTVDNAIETVATELDSNFFTRLGVSPTQEIKSLITKMIYYSSKAITPNGISVGEEYHVTEQDVKKIISKGSIYRGFTLGKWAYRLYEGASFAIGAGLIALPILTGMSPFTWGLASALGLSFALFPLTNLLINKSAVNVDYYHAIAIVESYALGRETTQKDGELYVDCYNVGDALFMAHKEDNNHDYTGRVKWMIEDKGSRVDEIWSELTPLERSFLRAKFCDVGMDGISTLSPEALQQIDLRAQTALQRYLSEINKALNKYREDRAQAGGNQNE